jgi:hypothetical protein
VENGLGKTHATFATSAEPMTTDVGEPRGASIVDRYYDRDERIPMRASRIMLARLTARQAD